MPRALPGRRHVKTAIGLLVEMALITAAVFLGLLADEWREDRQQQSLAERTLERFGVEVKTNRDTVEEVLTYHEQLREHVSAFLKSDGPKSFQAFAAQTQFKGIRPVSFEHSAWDLAVASGSLGYIDSDLALEIARTYTSQAKLERIQETFAQTSFAPTTFAAPDLTAFGITMQAYLTDVTIEEPHLVERYQMLTTDLDAAISGAPPTN